MPFSIALNQFLAMLFHYLFDLGKFGTGESMIFGQRNRTKLKLGLKIITRHLNVGWLMVFTAVKMKPIWPNAHHGRHWRG
jgi:hypothetical protein